MLNLSKLENSGASILVLGSLKSYGLQFWGTWELWSSVFKDLRTSIFWAWKLGSFSLQNLGALVFRTWSLILQHLGAREFWSLELVDLQIFRVSTFYKSLELQSLNLPSFPKKNPSQMKRASIYRVSMGLGWTWAWPLGH